MESPRKDETASVSGDLSFLQMAQWHMETPFSPSESTLRRRLEKVAHNCKYVLLVKMTISESLSKALCAKIITVHSLSNHKPFARATEQRLFAESMFGEGAVVLEFHDQIHTVTTAVERPRHSPLQYGLETLMKLTTTFVDALKKEEKEYVVILYANDLHHPGKKPILWFFSHMSDESRTAATIELSDLLNRWTADCFPASFTSAEQIEAPAPLLASQCDKNLARLAETESEKGIDHPSPSPAAKPISTMESSSATETVYVQCFRSCVYIGFAG